MATGFGDMSSLLKQAQDMQRRMADAQRSAGRTHPRRLVRRWRGEGVRQRQPGTAGGQDPEGRRRPDDVDTLEDLVTAAVRQAMQAAKELRDREMARSPAA
jgi:DNA-binding protein YbaB